MQACQHFFTYGPAIYLVSPQAIQASLILLNATCVLQHVLCPLFSTFLHFLYFASIIFPLFSTFLHFLYFASIIFPLFYFSSISLLCLHYNPPFFYFSPFSLLLLIISTLPPLDSPFLHFPLLYLARLSLHFLFFASIISPLFYKYPPFLCFSSFIYISSTFSLLGLLYFFSFSLNFFLFSLYSPFLYLPLSYMYYFSLQ